MDKYCIGVDFGTQSGRALLVRVADGKELAVSVQEYEHGVLTEHLPSGKGLPPNFALQHPQDYLEVLQQIIPDVLQKGKVLAEQVLGIGIAVTSSTILPVLKDGTPVCFVPEFFDDPHSWIKLWKHHGAQGEANELEQFLQSNAPELSVQFGASSAERLLPKALEVKRQSPRVYKSTFAFLEVADWLVWQLTGKLQRSAPMAGYKAMWTKENGYLSSDLLQAIGPEYEDVILNKLPGSVIPLQSAGTLTSQFASELGLKPDTIVAAGYIDAHSAMLGAGVSEPEHMVMVMGTTSCHMLLNKQLRPVEGMSGAIWDGIIPGYYGYEAGQSSVGDQFQWFVENALPADYMDAADAADVNIHYYLEQKARKIPLGCSGLLALDWWNGNRSVLNDATLSGLIVGLTTLTKPEEIYLALLESTAFGARRIMESFLQQDLGINKITVCGGLPRKNELLMEIYANVTNRVIEVAGSEYTSALGMAIVAAAAVGAERGGYATIAEAVGKMTLDPIKRYKPKPQTVAIYDVLYREYQKLHDYFGRGVNNVMPCLRSLAAKRGD